MKRFGLVGEPITGGGGWDQYAEEYDTFEDAKAAAAHWLERHYTALVWDNKTGRRWDIVFRYDGLGIA
jgi:hypothetical protein